MALAHNALRATPSYPTLVSTVHSIILCQLSFSSSFQWNQNLEMTNSASQYPSSQLLLLSAMHYNVSLFQPCIASFPSNQIWLSASLQSRFCIPHALHAWLCNSLRAKFALQTPPMQYAPILVCALYVVESSTMSSFANYFLQCKPNLVSTYNVHNFWMVYFQCDNLWTLYVVESSKM